MLQAVHRCRQVADRHTVAQRRDDSRKVGDRGFIGIHHHVAGCPCACTDSAPAGESVTGICGRSERYRLTGVINATRWRDQSRPGRTYMGIPVKTASGTAAKAAAVPL